MGTAYEYRYKLKSSLMKYKLKILNWFPENDSLIFALDWRIVSRKVNFWASVIESLFAFFQLSQTKTEELLNYYY